MDFAYNTMNLLFLHIKEILSLPKIQTCLLRCMFLSGPSLLVVRRNLVDTTAGGQYDAQEELIIR